MSNQPKHLYEFGDFRLAADRPRLTRNGEVVSLTPKALEILLVLVRSGGTLVEKEDLIKSVWPDTFVEEGNLSVHIFALRKALGETTDGEGYIETIPRLGYRFVGPVQENLLDGADLVVERHTLSQVVVEERSDSTNEKIIPVTQLTMPTRRAVLKQPVIVGVMLIVAASLTYYLFSSKAKPPAASFEVKSIAVLPFKTLGEKTDDEYLGLGLADALITQIGRSQQITVPSTSTVLRQVESEADPLAVGKRLGVEGVLEGSVQRAGERLRLTVRLLRVSDGVSLWAGTFDEKFTDIFAVQDSISTQVGNALLVDVTTAEPKLTGNRYSKNTEAYLEYLKGRYHWNKRTEDGLRKAAASFNQAISEDPVFAMAYAGLADTYALLCNYGETPKECFPKAKAAALRAVELDETLAEPHVALAFVTYRFERNWAEAEREFRRAIELNPNYATAHHWYGEYLGLAGRHPESIAELRQAQQLDPLSLIINTDLGAAYYKARQYDEALEQLRKTAEMEGKFSLVHLFMGMTYKQQGRYEQAIAELKEGVTLSGGRTIMIAVLGNIHGTSGRRAEALTALEELSELSKQRHVPSFEIALVYTGLGDKDKAFLWLEKSYEEHDSLLAYVKVDPNLDSLRSDARFADLLRRVGVTP